MSKDVRSRVLRRLSGLLSGCPPIDTRPQARAKLGILEIMRFRSVTRNTFGCRGPQPDPCFTHPTCNARGRYRFRAATQLRSAPARTARRSGRGGRRPPSRRCRARRRCLAPPRTPSGPKSKNRAATAQPPAKAAPNTSALIRMAALNTVSTFCQLMRRSPIVCGSFGHGVLGPECPASAAGLSPSRSAGSSLK